MTTLALAIGLLVVNIVKPGAGIDASKASGDITKYTDGAAQSSHSMVDFILGIIPDNVISAMAGGDLLPILLFAILFGLSLTAMGESAKPVTQLFDKLSHGFFGIVNMIMKLSPLAAFGAMSYTIGKFGIGSLTSLGKLMGSVYITMALFIIIVLGSIAAFYGFSIFSFIRYIKDEIFPLLGTSSSESALPLRHDG